MLLTRRRTLALSAAFAAGSALPVRAQQNWPQRSLRILVGTTPGGSPDIISRMLADKMAGPLGQSITIENNTGGGGGIAAAIVSHGPPDGYTMTLLTAGYASGAAVGKFPFDGDNTFACITMVCSYPFVFFGSEGFSDQVVPGHAGARQGPARQAQLCDHLAWRGLSPDRHLGRNEGRGRNGAGLLPRVAGGRLRRPRRARRRDAGACDLRFPAHRHRPVPRAGADLAGPLSADAGRADRCRDAARACSTCPGSAWRRPRARRGRSSIA